MALQEPDTLEADTLLSIRQEESRSTSIVGCRFSACNLYRITQARRLVHVHRPELARELVVERRTKDHPDEGARSDDNRPV